MKTYSTIIFLILSIFSFSVFSHEETQKVAIEPEIFSNQAGLITYEFQLIDLEKKSLIKDTDLTVEYEKILHFIAYDSALKEFHHLHPIYTGKNWLVQLDVKRNGDYWIWAQGLLTRNKTEFSSSNRLSIMGGTEAYPVPSKLQLARSGSDSISSISLSSTKVIAKKEAMINLRFSRTDGTTPVITNYLGALAHVIAVTDDGDSISHVHVMNSSKVNEGMIHATFNTAGKYRIWIQFLDNNILRTVPLAIEVF